MPEEATPPPPVAALIRDRREQQGLSRYDVARRAGKGVSEPTVRRYETGGRITRDPAIIAKIASVLRIVPAELAGAGRPDAAAELETLMARVAAHPDVAAVPAGLGGDDGSWAALMSEILAGFADIDAEHLPASVKAQLRQELIAGLARDAAERRRHLRVIREINSASGS